MNFIKLTLRGAPDTEGWFNPARIGFMQPNASGTIIYLDGLDHHAVIVRESPAEITQLIAISEAK